MAIKAPPPKPKAVTSTAEDDWISGQSTPSAPVLVGQGASQQKQAPKSPPALTGKTAPLMVRFDDAVLADLERAAEDAGLNKQAIVKTAVAAYLKHLKSQSRKQA